MGPSAELECHVRRSAGAHDDDGGRNRRAVPGEAPAGFAPRGLELIPPLTRTRWHDACRLVPSLYPAEGVLDAMATPEDLPYVFELESWTNDRISAELGIVHRVPQEEWVTGRPM